MNTGILTGPLCFTSLLQPRVWGGRALAEILQHALPSEQPYGEAWDVSALDCHDSCVADGPNKGRRLTELWNDHHTDLVGPHFKVEGGFPLLIKWLDCRDRLSVQVHPDDSMARSMLGEPRGKSEVWVVLEADPTARIWAGLKPSVTRDQFLAHLNTGTVEDCLHSFQPRTGDCVVLPAGTVHAAGGGLLIAEVQQSSDATFRLFDWNRLNSDGLPRALQVDLALHAMTWDQGPVQLAKARRLESPSNGVVAEELVRLPSFRLERYTIEGHLHAPHAGELTLWMVLDGTAHLMDKSSGEVRSIRRGRTVVIPAAASDFGWEPSHGNTATLLCVRLP